SPRCGHSIAQRSVRRRRTRSAPTSRRASAPRTRRVVPLQRIREDPDAIREGARIKGESAPVDEILALDERARALRASVEAARAEQRRASKELRGAPTDDQRRELDALKQRIQAEEADLDEMEARITTLLLEVPNPPHESVPVGRDASGNVVVRTW